MRFYKSLQKLTKATIFQGIYSVKSLTFIPFCPIAKYYWHFVISYRDKWKSSVCYCTISPLSNISKYFAIVKWKVNITVLQILSLLGYIFNFFSKKVLWNWSKDSDKVVGSVMPLQCMINSVLFQFTFYTILLNLRPIP